MVELRHQQTLRVLKPETISSNDQLSITVLDLYHDLSSILQESASEFCVVSSDNVLWPGRLAVAVAQHVLDEQLLCLPYVSEAIAQFRAGREYSSDLSPYEVCADFLKGVIISELFDEPSQNFLAEILGGLQTEDLTEVATKVFPSMRERSSSKVTSLLALLASGRSLDITITGTAHSTIMKYTSQHLPFFVSDATGINTRINEEGRILPKVIPPGSYGRGIVDRLKSSRFKGRPLFAMAYDITDETEEVLRYALLAIVLNPDSPKLRDFASLHPLVILV